jgi:hypothetical protein
VFLWCALTASCLLAPPPETTTNAPVRDQEERERTGETEQRVDFSPSVFHFVTIVADDREDKGGGWQEASASLSFCVWTHLVPKCWTCPVVVGLPIRAERYGTISPAHASEMTAEMATEASEVIHERPEWVTAAFCHAFTDRMKKLFDARYPKMGVRVHQ